MCGRYASSRKPEDLVEEFEISAPGANKVEEALAPDYNVAPTKLAPVVISRPPSDGPKDADAVRQLRLFKCGLLPNLSLSPNSGEDCRVR